MVEGHSVHRIASSFRSKLVGRKFAASSPNGRFADGAAAINGRVLSRMEVVGKNLFAFFNSDGKDGDIDEEVVVHVHFGMSGIWAVFNSSSEEEPEVKPTTRLRLEEILVKAEEEAKSKSSSLSASNKFITHLSAMTVAHGDLSLYNDKKSSLGQDPLRTDADPDLLYEKVAKSKKTIGQLLMDQSYFAGPGNIYRAEILFLAGVYPTTLGMALDRQSFNRVWNVSVKLLRRGYDTGSILTVDAAIDPSVAALGERRYIYNKSRCARCGGRVSSWDMSGRTCYACESGSCQPKLNTLPPPATGSGKNAASTTDMGDVKPAKGKKKTGKQQPKQHVPFISHCAPISLRQRLENGGADQLTIAEIWSVMEEMLGNNADGSDVLPAKSARKAVHVEALNNLLQAQQKHQKPGTAQGKVKKEKKKASKTTSTPSKPLPPPLVSAEDAAREKAVSGENRAVEHVAELSREQAVKVVASVTPSPAAGRTRGDEKKAGSKRGGNAGETQNGRRSSRRRLKYDS